MNECQAGVGLCGEEAECFNGVGTYLCRCKKDYEDHSPTKSGTLCIRTPRSGRGRNCSPAPSRSLVFSRCACERGHLCSAAGASAPWSEHTRPRGSLYHISLLMCDVTGVVALCPCLLW